MNILVTLNAGYLKQLIIMLVSLLRSNPARAIAVYVVHSALTPEHFARIEAVDPARCRVVSVPVSGDFLRDAPTTHRYMTEMYYRIFAAELLPSDLDRILYLDPDLVVINPLDELYSLDFQGNLFAAASHVRQSGVRKFNEVRLSMAEGVSYINSGVMLMNLPLLREEQDRAAVFDYIKSHRRRLMLPDQDVLNAVYGARILPIDTMRYNLSERVFGLYNLRPENWNNPLDILWVEQNARIIHYCGKNKPWKESYIGEFDRFYLRYERIAGERNLL